MKTKGQDVGVQRAATGRDALVFMEDLADRKDDVCFAIVMLPRYPLSF